jgi:hypothetical protein
MQNAPATERIVYVSRARGSDPHGDRAAILAVSRRNNGMDGITGILLAADGRYLQLIEGSAESVRATFDRIKLDPRHQDIVVIDEGEHLERLFGEWAMAGLPNEAPADAVARLKRLLRNVPADVAQLFLGPQGSPKGAAERPVDPAEG